MPFAIPEKWKWSQLLGIFDVYQPKTISTKELNDDGNYFVYGANGIIGKYTNYNHENSEVVIACRGATCGAVNITKPKSWINGNAMVVRPINNLVCHEYLVAFLKVFNWDQVTSGSAQPQITRKNLSSVLFPVPPIKEQHRIVTKLNQLFEQIDRAEKAYNELSGPLSDRFRQLCLEKAIQGKLVPQLESEPEAAQIGEVPAEIPFEVPKKWKWCRLKELTFPAKQKIPDKEFLYLDVSSIDQTTKSIKGFKKLNSSTAPSRARKSLKEGMVLFATVRPYLLNTVIFEGNKNNIEAIASTAFATFTCNEALLNIYIWLVLQSPYFFDYVSRSQRGVSYPAITDKQFFDAYIPLPPLKEQCRIVAKLNKLLSDVTKIESPVSTP